MFTVARLRQKPRHFKSFAGVTVEQFDTLLEALTPLYEAREHARKSSPTRQRAIGAGHPFTRKLPERLLMTLMYLRLYVTESLLGYLFDLHESSVNRERTLRMMPVLLEVLPVPMRDELGLVHSVGAEPGGCRGANEGADPARRKRIGTLEELLEAHPEIHEVLIDATEQPTQRPKDKQAQREHYSGKKKRHTMKTQVVTTDKRVLHASRHVPGSVHDLVLLRFSGVLHPLQGCRVRVDRGYEGVEAEYPGVPIEKPIRARRNHRVTALGKAYNRMQSRLRIAVEHVLARLEQYRILAGLYRGQRTRYDDCFGVVAGLNNFRVMDCLAW
jgi:hypothetical protein